MENEKSLELTIEDYDINGLGVSHNTSNKIIFVEKALKDEKVIASITSSHKKFAFAKTLEVLVPSKDRIEPACPYYALCGGCDLLHLTYEVEKTIKEHKVSQTLRDCLANTKINPIIASSNTFHYRNKVMVPFGTNENGIIYGFYKKNSHDIIPMKECLISKSIANDILGIIRDYLEDKNISIYNEETNKGLFREVMLRNNCHDHYMVILVVTKKADFKELVDLLVSKYPMIDSIYLNINADKTNVVLSDIYHHLYGAKTITETILGLDFSVSPDSFLQVNHDQCEALYEEAIRLAGLTKEMQVIDAYCGMGSITLNIAKKVKKVYGIEIVPAAIENAKGNMVKNNVTNANFTCGKCEDEIAKLVKNEQIDVIFFDPPRKGCDAHFLEVVIEAKIKKIVYISCNIASAARDIKILLEHGYELKEVTPVDLFSRTSHVESISMLEMKEDKKPVKTNLKIIPKADIEMMREDQYEQTGNLNQKKYKEY